MLRYEFKLNKFEEKYDVFLSIKKKGIFKDYMIKMQNSEGGL